MRSAGGHRQSSISPTPSIEGYTQKCTAPQLARYLASHLTSQWKLGIMAAGAKVCRSSANGLL